MTLQEVFCMRIQLVLVLTGASVWSPRANAQGRTADWLTHSGDAQRTGWQKVESTITPESVQNFKLLWKLKFENQQKGLYSLMEPLIVGRVITNRGFKEMALVAASDDNIFAVDADLGKVLWQKHFAYSSETPKSTVSNWLCPGGLTATPVVRPPPNLSGTATTPPPAASSAAAPAPTPARRPASSVRGVYLISSDGSLHELNLASGEDMTAPMKFEPPNGKTYSLSMIDDVIYASTAQHCGGNPNGVWAIDPNSADKKVETFRTNGGGIWGLGGPAVGTDGTIYAEVGDGAWDPAKGQYSDTVLALTPKDLKLKDWYTPTNREWITKRDLDMNTTPTVFAYKGRDLLVAAGKEGRLFLLDSKALGGADHRTPMFRSELIANWDNVDFAGEGIWGGFATWQDSGGTRWVLAPIWGAVNPSVKFAGVNGDAPHGGIAAFKVEDKDGKTVLTPAWVSRDMINPAPPVVANGVVFALSSGEYVRQADENQGGLFTVEQRAERSEHAILYALDAQTGKELWSSGASIGSFTHFAGMAVANGRVYFGTFDNTLYSFGLPMEH
jgi:outer membrane protein assembly factor BamB